jgi:glycine betaine catabolism B
MTHTGFPIRAFLRLALLLGLLWASGLCAQSPEEHASHHPGQPGGATPAAAAMPAAGAGTAPAAMPGSTGGPAEMMKGMMGPPPPKELYPSLMALPELSPEQRKQVEEQADQRMHAGSVLMGQALDSLNAGTQSGDYAGMHEAAVLLAEGLAQLESGIAARRALAEGRAPSEVALAWFRREMNLSLGAAPAAQQPGVTAMHLVTMVLLIAFALAMVAMYFFKMRRAAALFGRIEPDSGAPPLGGAPRPSSPVAPPSGKAPLSGGPPATPASSGTPVAGSAPPGGRSARPNSVATSSPLTANWRGQLRVESIVTETPSVKTFRLVPSSADGRMPFTFVPGQFLNVAFWIGGARMNRSYSLSSSPTQRDYVELTVRREARGAVSRHINDLLKVGDEIDVGGPVGRFTFEGMEADSIVLIAGGVGITPMMSITRYLTERSWAGDVFFIYACRAPTDFIFANELAELQRVNPRLHVAVTMSRPEGTDWKGPSGRLTKELLTQTVPDLASRRIHLCGPPSMMESTKAILAELGVAPDQVRTELFGATKPTPSPAGTTARPTLPATGPLVTFSKNNKSAKIRVGQTVLELSEDLDIGIASSCRVGTCGVCKVKMTSGEVEMAVEDALDADDKAKGIILACQAKPKSDIAVEA